MIFLLNIYIKKFYNYNTYKLNSKNIKKKYVNSSNGDNAASWRIILCSQGSSLTYELLKSEGYEMNILSSRQRQYMCHKECVN